MMHKTRKDKFNNEVFKEKPEQTWEETSCPEEGKKKMREKKKPVFL